VNIVELRPADLSNALTYLSPELATLMREHPGELVVAGGLLRAVVAKEEVRDVDVFAASKELALGAAERLDQGRGRLLRGKSAVTVVASSTYKYPVQLVHRWSFASPAELVESFDFSVCQAVLWYDGLGTARGIAGSRFYEDVHYKRLAYSSPVRDEEAGASFLRVLKYYQKGYKISFGSLGKVAARLFAATGPTSEDAEARRQREAALAVVLTRLLLEADRSSDGTDYMADGSRENF